MAFFRKMALAVARGRGYDSADLTIWPEQPLVAWKIADARNNATRCSVGGESLSDPLPAAAASQASLTVPVAAAEPTASPAPPVDKKVREYQRAFLLRQLETAPHHRLSRGEANKRLSAGARKVLHLDPGEANQVREELAAENHVRVTKKGTSAVYELTDQGREYVKTLAQYPFPSRGRDDNETVSEEVRKCRQTYLLLQLFPEAGKSLTKGEANRLPGLGKSVLELTAAAANRLRRELAAEGLLAITSEGRHENYRLTPTGRDYLAANAHFPERPIQIDGHALNALLLAARLAGRPQSAPSEMANAAEGEPAPPADLAQAAYREFEELRREKYGHTGLVPIHEIRDALATRYGPRAARHDTLDEALHELRRKGQVRMLAIVDLQKATTEQLNGSVPGVNETLFYLEDAHA